MRHHGDSLAFAPRLPPRIKGLTFRITFLGRLLKVSVTRNRVTYTMVRGKALTFDHYGKAVRLASGRSVIRPIPKLSMREEPRQPPGREPARRGSEEPRQLRPRRGPRAPRESPRPVT
jgi:alpha,alpha-trehalose phosphorylase